jgi:hypothetical protein
MTGGMSHNISDQPSGQEVRSILRPEIVIVAVFIHFYLRDRKLMQEKL